LALLMIDIDDFKAYNETYGHQKGDQCLRQVALAMNEVIKRAGDFVVRYGGEEFAVVLPNTDSEGAVAVAEQLRSVIDSLNIPHEQSSVGDTLTVSIGIAAGVPQQGGDRRQIVAAAESALYVAKGEGRNRIRVANDSCA
ncbi:MAG TPA: GGDEF domain-containing protein, partial [Desulfurivibrionaceae bacterium]|nr:GGDEF domain-containing protein [Desulfurivibrionaceae bacterium]